MDIAYIRKELANRRAQLHDLGARRLRLFGSVARGDDRPESDLDFLVDLERKTFDDYMGIKFLLEDLFQRKVDLISETGIKPRIRDQILAEAIDVA